MRFKYIRTCCVVTVLVLLSACFTAMNANAAVNLPDGFVIFDNEERKATPEGYYFILADDLAPQEQRTKRIYIQNQRTDKAFDLFLKVEAVDKKGNIDLFKDVELTITYDGEQLFKGSADGTGTIDMTKPIDLGNYIPGEEKKMDVLIDYKNDSSEGYGSCTFRWDFQAVVDETFIPPKTGIDESDVVWMLIGAMFLTGIVLVAIKRLRRKKALGEGIK